MRVVLLVIILLPIIHSCKPKAKSQPKEQSFSRIHKDGSWGYIDNNGDTLIPLDKYEFLNPIDAEGMILAHSSGKSGYINIHQDPLIDFIYEDLGVFSNGLAPAKKNGKWGFLDRTGNIIISHKFDNESYFYKCGLASAKVNGKWDLSIDWEILLYQSSMMALGTLKLIAWSAYRWIKNGLSSPVMDNN